MRRAGLMLLLTAILAVSGVMPVYGTEGEPAVAQEQEAYRETAAVSDGYEPMAENERHILYMDTATTAFAVQDKGSSRIVYSSPPGIDDDAAAFGQEKTRLKSLLTAQFINPDSNILEKVNSHAECVMENKYRIAKGDSGVRVTFLFENYGIEIPVDILLTARGFSVSVDTGRITEQGDYLVAEFTPVPGLGAGHVQEDGFLLVPDGSGGIIRFTDSKPMAPDYRGEIYGRDHNQAVDIRPIAENMVRLPVFGISRRDQGVLAVVSAGEGDGAIVAAPSNRASSYSTAACSFTVRNQETFTMSAGTNSQQTVLWERGALLPQKYAVTYIPLGDDELSYAAMAGAYRQYLLDEGQIREAFDGRYPLVMNLYGAVSKQKHFLGIPYTGVQALTTYKEARQMIEGAHERGIDALDVLYDYAFQETVKGSVMTKASPASGLGGKGNLRKLLAFAEESPATAVYPVVDYVRYRESNMITGFSSGVKGISGLPSTQHPFDLVTGDADETAGKYGLLRVAKLETHAAKLAKSLGKLGITHAGIQNAGTITYSDMNGARARKSMMAENLAKSLAAFDGQTLFIRDANAYALAAASAVTLPPAGSGLDIVSESVPFYPLVISGLIPYAAPAVNLDSMPADAYLQAVEYGALLQYVLIGAPPETLRHTELEHLYSCGYDQWIDRAAEQYAAVKAVYARTGSHRIVGHERPAPGVARTTYENGLRVYVNYNASPVQVDGITIDSRSFSVGEGD